MIINHNLMALNTHRQMSINDSAAAKCLEKLSSGYRINRAGDDAAGLAISEKMRGQIRGLNQAARNAQDGISLIQTAEGALNETHSILQRMRELAVQAANDTNTTAEREKIQQEVNQLAQEITRIANDIEFNTMNLLGGNLSGADAALVFHVGANSGQNVRLNIKAMDAFSLGVASGTAANFSNGNMVAKATVTKGVNVSTQSGADKAITTINNALEKVSEQRSALGAMQNRLEHTITNLKTSSENLQASESRIRDVDMAMEMMEFIKTSILQQAATAMLAQANQQPQTVLQLLR